MHNIKLQDVHFNDMLPSSINQDETVKSLSDSLQNQITSYESDLKKIAIWSNLDDIGEPLLSSLGWQLSLTHEYIWQLAESDEAKRNLLKIATPLHQHKGTVWAVKNIIRALGFGEVKIVEGIGIRYRDGSFTRNAQKTHIGHQKGWPFYRVIFEQPLTNDVVALLKKAIPEYAPKRSVLYSLDFKEATIRYNGVALHDGSYNRGEA